MKLTFLFSALPLLPSFVCVRVERIVVQFSVGRQIFGFVAATVTTHFIWCDWLHFKCNFMFEWYVIGNVTLSIVGRLQPRSAFRIFSLHFCFSAAPMVRCECGSRICTKLTAARRCRKAMNKFRVNTGSEMFDTLAQVWWLMDNRCTRWMAGHYSIKRQLKMHPKSAINKPGTR